MGYSRCPQLQAMGHWELAHASSGWTSFCQSAVPERLGTTGLQDLGLLKGHPQFSLPALQVSRFWIGQDGWFLFCWYQEVSPVRLGGSPFTPMSSKFPLCLLIPLGLTFKGLQTEKFRLWEWSPIPSLCSTMTSPLEVDTTISMRGDIPKMW